MARRSRAALVRELDRLHEDLLYLMECLLEDLGGEFKYELFNTLQSARESTVLPAAQREVIVDAQREVARQHKLMLKADHAHQQLLLVVQGLKRLFADEHFVTLLRAEGLDSLPKYLADRIETA